jgi:hypothetical protein
MDKMQDYMRRREAEQRVIEAARAYVYDMNAGEVCEIRWLEMALGELDGLVGD